VDSVALLLLVSQIVRRQPKWRLEVVHFNHGLRPEVADEEAFVRGLAEEHGLRCHVRRAVPGELEGRGGMQELAREWRRRESVGLLPPPTGSCRSGGSSPAGGVVLLAHHLDDQVETRLLKLLRGAHLARLGGMRPREGPFARPLLQVPKARLVEYLREREQRWMEDPSNATPVYQRNKVRLQLIPLLADIMGGEEALRRRVEATAAQSGQLAAWLDEACEAHGGPPFPKPPAEVEEVEELSTGAAFQALPEMVRHEVVWRFIANTTGSLPGFGTVDAVVRAVSTASGEGAQTGRAGTGGRGGGRAEAAARAWCWPLAGGWDLERREGRLVLRPAADSGPEEQHASDLCLRVAAGQPGARLRAARGSAAASESRGEEEEDGGGRGAQTLVLHRVPEGATLELRGAGAGDRFCPGASPRARPVKLTQFLNRALGVPPSDRPHWPVLALRSPGAASGAVVVVCPGTVAGAHREPRDTDAVPPVTVRVRWGQLWRGLPRRGEPSGGGGEE